MNGLQHRRHPLDVIALEQRQMQQLRQQYQEIPQYHHLPPQLPERLQRASIALSSRVNSQGS